MFGLIMSLIKSASSGDFNSEWFDRFIGRELG